MMKTLTLIASTLGLALAACGDHAAQPDAAPPVDAQAGPPRAVVVAGDFMAGSVGVLSTLDPVTREVKMDVGPKLAVGSDPILRHFGTELFIINRRENNITILDDQTLAFKEQIGTGAGSNPQDVALVGTKLYVPTLGTKGVTVLTRGSTATTEIDLSADDPDAKPDCDSAYTVGTDVYVSCGLLAGFSPTVAGKVYVIDSATNTIQAGRTITLLHKNPFGLFERIPGGAPHEGDLVIPTVEDFVAPGCVERFTPGATPSASTCLVDNTELGGYASRVAFQVDEAHAITFFAVPTSFPKADLRAFDMPSSTFWTGPLNPSTQAITDVVVCPEGQLVVADTATVPNGLRIYNGATELTTATLPIGKPPKSTNGLVCY